MSILAPPGKFLSVDTTSTEVGLNIVIIAGGAGSRLWPVSREANPKPFIRLKDGLSLLQKTFLRGMSVLGVNSVTTVTNQELFFRVEDEYHGLSSGIPLHFLLEPFGRNTAPAICAAALELRTRYGDDALMLVLPADHLINKQDAFIHAVSLAAKAAAERRLVTFGVKPTRAETGFGYMEVLDCFDIVNNQVLDVNRFIEKPDQKTAQQYLAGNRHLWNSGMFCFRAGTLLDELTIHASELVQSVSGALGAASHNQVAGHTITRLMPDTFDAIEDDSIDRVLMEKSNRVVVVPCDLAWSDIGSWQAMADLVEADDAGNRIEGKADLESCRNVYIRSPHRLTVGVGIEDLMIVDTADALLIAHRDQCQNVKKIVDRLKARGDELHQYHITAHRPWGTYTVLEEGESFKIKRIEVKPGASLSLQMHHHRSEHWIVVSGTAKVINGEKELLLHINESTYIPAGHKHRLENPGTILLVIIEVQSGEYLGEDDIVRFEDSYGRC